MPDLAPTKTHQKQFFWTLGWLQAGPHQKDVQSRSLKTKKCSVWSRDIIDFRVPNLHMYPTYAWRKTANGTKNITLRETFPTGHIHNSHPDCHATCPGPNTILLSKRHTVCTSISSICDVSKRVRMKNVRTRGPARKARWQTPEIPLIRCKRYICILPPWNAKPPMTQRMVFFEIHVLHNI